jgi:hypothetical protein
MGIQDIRGYEYPRPIGPSRSTILRWKRILGRLGAFMGYPTASPKSELPARNMGNSPKKGDIQMDKVTTVVTRSCEKPECEYYVDIELTLGSRPRGVLTHLHCMLCKHLIRDNDLYTRWVVGEEIDDGD